VRERGWRRTPRMSILWWVGMAPWARLGLLRLDFVPSQSARSGPLRCPY
jgi:hypothetical protein